MVFAREGTSRNKVYQLRGLVSFSALDPNNRICDTKKYVVFTDVAKYLKWIQTVINVHPLNSFSFDEEKIPDNWRPEGEGETFEQTKDDEDPKEYLTSDLHPPVSILGNRPNNKIPSAALSPSACGTVAIQPVPLITYGQPTYEGQYPWHAALYFSKGIGLSYICGGSLISERHVLTVAHCVTRKKTNGPLKPDSLVVYLGKYYLKRWSNPGMQQRQVEKIISHPDYESNAYKNDIALIKLMTPAQYSDYVRPICLWGQGESRGVGRIGTVVGWGFDETGHITEKLMEASMPIVLQKTCINSYPEFFSRFTNPKTFCAGFKNGTSVCNGDSGGGMVLAKPGTNPPVWEIRGLVSLSVALQNQFKCDEGHYVIFTDIALYLRWIEENMQI